MSAKHTIKVSPLKQNELEEAHCIARLAFGTFLTAEAIAQRVGVEVSCLPALREIHFGTWEGLDWQEIEDRFPREADRWLREFPMQSAPGGEAYAEFTARIDGVIAPMIKDAAEMTTAI